MKKIDTKKRRATSKANAIKLKIMIILIGPDWMYDVLDLLKDGPLRFVEIMDLLTPISKKSLSKCLNCFITNQMIEKLETEENSQIYVLKITEKGTKLLKNTFKKLINDGETHSIMMNKLPIIKPIL